MKIAILGARGMIGRQWLNILESHTCELDCFGKTGGAELTFQDKTIRTKGMDAFDPKNYDVILSAVDAEIIKPLKEKIMASGAIWVDKSSAMRMDEEIPLVVPEVNADAMHGHVFASPNCVVIPIAMFLNAVVEYEILNVNIASYQSVSGAGTAAMHAFFKEIKSSSMNALNHGLYYKDPMAFNVIPAIGAINEDGHCDEEVKIKQELKKILHGKIDAEMPIAATTVRVPVTIGHSIALNFILNKPVKKDQIVKLLSEHSVTYSEGLITPLIAAKEDVVFACRLRNNGANNWSVMLVCDNLRKGGALNAWQIVQKQIGDKYEQN